MVVMKGKHMIIAILVVILLRPVLTSRDLYLTYDRNVATTTVTCSSNGSEVFSTFDGLDLTWSNTNGQVTLIGEGLLVKRCSEQIGEITCVFNTSVAEGTFVCCADPDCDNVTLCKFKCASMFNVYQYSIFSCVAFLS